MKTGKNGGYSRIKFLTCHDVPVLCIDCLSICSLAQVIKVLVSGIKVLVPGKAVAVIRVCGVA